MEFWAPLQRGTLLKRYKRFFADIILEDGRTVTAHCVNTGAMMGLTTPGSKVWVCPKRESSQGKLEFVWMLEEEVDQEGVTFIGTNTSTPGAVVREAFAQKKIPALAKYDLVKPEIKVGASRLDFLLGSSEDSSRCFVEVKNVHLKFEDTALFPDCVTERGTKHLHLLADLAQKGERAMMLYIVQRGDCKNFSVAGCFDQVYGRAFEEVLEKGVEVVAYGCAITPEGVCLQEDPLTVQPVRWDPIV